MKLLVQARKDGYNVLYPKPTPTEFFQFAGDIKRIDSNSGSFLGKYIYSIALARGGCIFTKHVIVQDVQRQSLGNVGFSVFIPKFNKLSGIDVKTLLDELIKTYCDNYCPDYYLINVHENWTLFEAIADQYERRLHDHSTYKVANYEQGTSEAAFIYYADESDLCNFFDAPFQEEYSTHKQVFLVEKRLKDLPENPLNTLRHDSNADLTEKLDLNKLIVLKIHARDDENGNYVPNFKLRRINDEKEIQENDTELIFRNDDIYKSWKIYVEHIDYETYIFDYIPAEDHNIKYLDLKKIQTTGGKFQIGNTPKEIKFRIKIDEKKGKWSFNGNPIPKYVDERPRKCDAQPGYKFESWVYRIDGQNGYYEAIFIKLRYFKIPKLAWILIVFIITAISSILYISKSSVNSVINEPANSLEITNRINTYIDGIELNKDTLEKFKSSYCNSVLPSIRNESEKSIWQTIWTFLLKKDEFQSQLSDGLPQYCSKIDSAISIREAINLGQIDKLLSHTYSEQQQNFKLAINGIESIYKKQIKDTLYTPRVSKMNLNEITELILNLQKELQSQENLYRKASSNTKANINLGKTASAEAIKKEEKKSTNKTTDNPNSASLSTEYSLADKFWALVRKPETPQKNSYDTLLFKYYYNKDTRISNPTKYEQDIISYLQEICKSSSAFEPYAKDIRFIDRQNATTIADLRDLINQKK